MAGSSLWIAVTFLVQAAWLSLMPRDVRGRGWHVVLSSIPPAVGILHAVLPDGLLRDSLTAWMVSGVGVLAVLAGAWLVGTATRNHGMMDIAYPLAPIAVAGTTAARGVGSPSASGWIVLALVSLWGIRLSVQTLRDNHGREREPYATWRARGGPRWLWWSIFQVYLLQGVTLWIWSLSLLLAITAGLSPIPIAFGIVVWVTGFVLQAGADHQLARFRHNPANRGRILDTGMWAIVRQPNYLGEALIWWGYFACAMAHPLGVLAIVGPIYATWFMGFGSAGPFKERHMARTRGAAWAEYCARTPRFFPWPRLPPAN